MSRHTHTSASLPFAPTDRDRARLDDELRAVAQDDVRASRRSLRDLPREWGEHGRAGQVRERVRQVWERAGHGLGDMRRAL